MASSICRSMSLSNLRVKSATITSVATFKNNSWYFTSDTVVYDVAVTWSDFRQERVCDVTIRSIDSLVLGNYLNLKTLLFEP